MNSLYRLTTIPNRKPFAERLPSKICVMLTAQTPEISAELTKSFRFLTWIP
jgi:hypothetical protein